MESEEVKKLFKAHGGWLKAADLKKLGSNYHQINAMLAKGEIERAGRGIYRLASVPEDEKVLISKIVPNGVFCLFTACLHYGLSTFTPSELHLAIPQKAKYTLPEYPPVRLYYWDKTSLETGVVEVDIVDRQVKMSDLEKTVCDMVRLRNKVGLDIVKEVIKNYLDRTDRNLVRLVQYARKLRVEKHVKNYIEILL